MCMKFSGRMGIAFRCHVTPGIALCKVLGITLLLIVCISMSVAAEDATTASIGDAASSVTQQQYEEAWQRLRERLGMREVGGGQAPSSRFATASDLLQGRERTNETAAAATLIKWLISNGMKEVDEPSFPLKVDVDYHVSVYASGKARGNIYIVAARNITKDEALLSLPSKFWMSTSQLELNDPLQGRDDRPSGHLLALHLLRERSKGPLSFWYPYIASLPEYVPLPLFYPPPLLSAMESAEISRQVTASHEIVSKAYSALSSSAAVASLGFNFTKDEYFWALTMVHSRAFEDRSSGQLPPGASSLDDARRKGLQPVLLAPVTDLFDNGRPANVQFYFEDGKFVFRATSDVTAGSNLVIEYQPKIKSVWTILKYGFLMEANVHDCVELFHDSDDVITFFSGLFLDGDVSILEDARNTLQDVAKAVQEEIMNEKYSAYRAQLNFKLEEGHAPVVCFNGRFDPYLLAGMLALYKRFVENSEVNHEALATAATRFGWVKNPQSSCSDFVSWAGNDMDSSVLLATSAIHKKLLQVSKSYESTHTNDVVMLSIVRDCVKLLADRDVNSRRCPADLIGHLSEVENVMMYRTLMYSVMKQAIGRLQKECDVIEL